LFPKNPKHHSWRELRKVQSFLRAFPGFVEELLYEKKDGESRHNFLTTAIWESEEAFENAKRAIAIEFQKPGFDPRKRPNA